MHSQNCWLHPTYTVDPISVSRRDFTLFFKRLRKAGHKFKYFGVAEYGEKLSRPHGHICLFGTDFPDKYPWKKEGKHLLYRSPTLEKYWQWGHILIGELTPEAAEYTAGYCQKKINGELAADHYQREIHGHLVDVSPEIPMMSKGLGYTWLEKFWQDIYPCDFVVVSGKERSVPRHYDFWLKKHHPDVWKIVQAKRFAFVKANFKNEPEITKINAAKSRDGRYNQKKRRFESGDLHGLPEQKTSQTNA